MQNQRKTKNFRYTHTTLALIGLGIAFLLSRIDSFHIYILGLGSFGYIGAFLSGMFFVSTFTVATSALVLFMLAETLPPFMLAGIAGIGAVVGDLLIFRFVQQSLRKEVIEIWSRIDCKKRIQRAMFSRSTKWILPVLGAMIIASPFPDEIGISLMGLSRMQPAQFIIISYILNTLGIFSMVYVSRFL